MCINIIALQLKEIEQSTNFAPTLQQCKSKYDSQYYNTSTNMHKKLSIARNLKLACKWLYTH
jgi:hypothetical protein